MTSNDDLRIARQSKSVPVLEGDNPSEVLRRLELKISRKLDGLLHGDYEGLVPGHGSELGESRNYVPGDDVRRIDWNVSARTNEVHIRETVADRELETWIFVDLTPSLAFGTVGCEKRDLAVASAAAIGFLTQKTGNRIGGSILGTSGLVSVPARTGRKHLRAFLHQILVTSSDDGAPQETLAHALSSLGRSARRRGLVVVISDFLDRSDWETAIGIVATRHDVLAIEITDPREMELPDVGLVEMVDPESGRRVEVQTRSRKVRRRFREAAVAQRSEISAALRRTRADHLMLSTDRDWMDDLVRFVNLRHHRLERVGAMGRH